MMIKNFFVIDTNCFISANLLKNSTNALVFDKILINGRIALSSMILNEYAEVLYRKKLDRYINDEKRQHALRFIEKNAILFTPVETVIECRDHSDNKFLELALACQASCIISGDADLLIMNPFRGIPILSPIKFLNSFDF